MNPEEQFWGWFLSHERELFQFDPCGEDAREKLFDDMAGELHKVHRALAFEFGPPETKREFVISAAGIRSAFPAVARLAAAAPSLERWQIVAFRPRRSPVMSIEINGKLISPTDVQFTLLDNGKMAGLHLFIPGYQEEDLDFKQIGYLLLDETLGEYDVEMRLGLIKMLPPDARTDGDRHSLPELPVLFDRLVSRLEGRSGAAS